MSAIQADYRTQKHIPSRKCYQLIMEVAEEDYPEVCRVLGYPKTGENTFVGIALLDKGVCDNIRKFGSEFIAPLPIKPVYTEQTEGERLRTRAHTYPKNELFQDFARTFVTHGTRQEAAVFAIYEYCNITSRSELATNLEAQNKFKELLAKYESWKLEQQYKDNLGRI